MVQVTLEEEDVGLQVTMKKMMKTNNDSTKKIKTLRLVLKKKLQIQQIEKGDHHHMLMVIPCINSPLLGVKRLLHAHTKVVHYL